MFQNIFFKAASCIVITVLTISTIQISAQSTRLSSIGSDIPQRANLSKNLKKLDRIPGKYIIKYKDGQAPDRQLNISTSGENLDRDISLFSNVVTFKSNQKFQQGQSLNQLENRYKTENEIQKVIEESDKVILELKNNPRIESVEPDYIVRSDFTPNDTYINPEWALNNTGQTGGTSGKDIRAYTAWDINQGSSDIVIAVVDSGVQLTHPDLVNKFYKNSSNQIVGYDFANNDSDPTDDYGHGTHVAGLVGAQTNNSLGVAGTCPNCKIMPIKFLDNTGSGSTSNAILAINYAVTNGAKIINNSWGGAPYTDALQTAINNAYNNGVVVVASAGNSNSSALNYPAAYNHVISVASTDSSDRKSSFSNYGTWVDVSAPGTSILSTILPLSTLSANCSDANFAPNGDGYGYCSGTSMSSPIVAGIAGLVMSQFPTYNPDQVKSQIKNTTDSIESLNPSYLGQMGTGRVNAYRALNTVAAPSLKYSSNSVADPLGNNNSLAEPGESVNVAVSITNDWGLSTNTSGILSTTDTSYITVTNNTANFGNVASGSTATGTFAININNSTQTPRTVPFTLTLSANGGYSKVVNFNIDILSPLVIPQTWGFDTTTQNWTGSTGSLWHLSDTCANAPMTAGTPKYWHYGQANCGSYDTGASNAGKLYSPPIKGLANDQNAYLSYDQFLETENSPANYDQAIVKAKVYGADDSTAVVLGGPYTNSTAWENKKIAIPTSVSNASVFQIFFDFNTTDNFSNAYKGWFIDNVKILKSINPSEVLISEIGWTGSPAANDDYFLEFYNNTNSPIDLSGNTIYNAGVGATINLPINQGTTSGIGTCTNTIIAPKDYFLIANHSKVDAATMLNVEPDCNYSALNLSGTGKQISLKTPVLLTIDQTPTGTWAAGINTNCLTTTATLPCSSMTRDITAMDGTLASNWYNSTQSLNMDTNFTYLNDAPAPRSVWVANTVPSGEKMTPKASNGIKNPSTANSFSFCQSQMHYNKAFRASDSGAICPQVITENNNQAQGYYLSYGPYLSNLAVGQTYTATFRLKATGASNISNQALRLDVVDGAFNSLGTNYPSESDFVSGNYITKNITFTVQNSLNIETRVYVYKDAPNYSLDQITITKGSINNDFWIYESENLQTTNSYATIYNDVNASNTKGRKTDTGGYLQYGPYTKNQTGGSWYTATFRLKADPYTSPSPETKYLLIDAFNSGGYNTLGRKEIKFNQLTNNYQDYSFNFYKPDDVGTMEYRISSYFTGLMIYTDKVTITKIQPPSSLTNTIETELSLSSTVISNISDSGVDVRSTTQPIFMQFGPYTNEFPTSAASGFGNYTATFYIKNTGNATGNIAYVDIYNGRGGSSQTLGSKTITNTQLSNTAYTAISVPFTRSDLVGSLEFRVKNLINGNELRVDKVIVNKV